MNNNKTVAIVVIAAVAAIMIAGVAFSAEHAYATKKKTQTVAQDNVCANGNLPLNIRCQNADSQVQGSDNLATVTASQP